MRGTGDGEPRGVDGLAWSSNGLVSERDHEPGIQRLRIRTQGFVSLHLWWSGRL